GSAPPPLRPILYVAASGTPPIPHATSRLLMPPSRIVSASCFRSAPISKCPPQRHPPGTHHTTCSITILSNAASDMDVSTIDFLNPAIFNKR
ncbi:hypothetical protein BHE74_00055839, partial [Ensete ventricosum]